MRFGRESFVDGLLSLLIGLPVILPKVCAIVGGTLLLYHGLWKQIAWGVGLYLACGFGLGFLDMLSLPLVALGAHLKEDRRQIASAVAIWLGGLWERAIAMMIVSAAYVWFLEGPTPGPYWPLVIWGFAVAVGSVAPVIHNPDEVIAAVIRVVEAEIVYLLWVFGRAAGFSPIDIGVVSLLIVAAEAWVCSAIAAYSHPS